jgi:transposase InsO family protein
VREVYGYEKPQGGGGTGRAMPFAASERHEVWSADVRHLDMDDEGLLGGKAYAVAVMDNYSRAILASAVARRQDLSAFLSVLYQAVERHGAPGTLVTDSGSVFLSNRAKAVYAKLGVSKEEIEKGRPWQNYSETTFGIQRRMANWHFARAESWADLAEAHDWFVRDFNAQEHFAHQRREDGRRSREVLFWVSGMRFHPEDLERAFRLATRQRPRHARPKRRPKERAVALVGGVDPLFDAVDPDPSAVRDDALRVGVPEVQVEHRQRPGVVLAQHLSDDLLLLASEAGSFLGGVWAFEVPGFGPSDEDGSEALE